MKVIFWHQWIVWFKYTDLNVKKLWNLFQSTYDSRYKPGKYFLKSNVVSKIVVIETDIYLD